MGRKGYKGICEIGTNLFLLNDDGCHIIKFIRIKEYRASFESITICGQEGIEGTEDHNIGRLGLISRPGRFNFLFSVSFLFLFLVCFTLLS